MALGHLEKRSDKWVVRPGGNQVVIADADNVQFTVIKSWNKTRWVKDAKVLTGTADLELLDRLAGLVRLPPIIEQLRSDLRAVQDAIDRERTNPEPVPFYNYPVKMPLYAHQTRGSNMCLLAFGWVPPEKGAAT